MFSSWEQANTNSESKKTLIVLLVDRLLTFVDFISSTHLRLACFSQMTSMVIYCPTMARCDAIKELIESIFGNMCEKDDIQPESLSSLYHEVMLIVHAPKF